MSDITAADFTRIARFLVERHGDDALHFARSAEAEMADRGDEERARNWAALGAFIEDLVEGRPDGNPVTLH